MRKRFVRVRECVRVEEEDDEMVYVCESVCESVSSDEQKVYVCERVCERSTEITHTLTRGRGPLPLPLPLPRRPLAR